MLVAPTPPSEKIQIKGSVVIGGICSYADILKARGELSQQFPEVSDAQIVLDEDANFTPSSLFDDHSSYVLRFSVEVDNPHFDTQYKTYKDQLLVYENRLAKQESQRRVEHEAQLARKEFKETSHQERKKKREVQDYLKKSLASGNDIIIIDGTAYKLTSKL